MPNIQTYTSGARPLEADNTGVYAEQSDAYHTERFARMEGDAYKQVGQQAVGVIRQAEQHAAASEIGQGFASLAGMQNQLTQEWNQTVKTADPNDPNVAQNFHENIVQPVLDKWQQSFSTRQGQLWASEHAAALGEHMFNRAMADQSTMAGAAVVKNLNAVRAQSTDMVYKDPTTLDLALNTVDGSMKAIVKNSPALSVADAAKITGPETEAMKRELVLSAGRGIADNNPAAMSKFLDSDPAAAKYLSTQDKDQLMHYAELQSRMAVEQKRANQTWQIRQNRIAAEQRASDLISGAVDPKTGAIHITPDFFKNAAKIGEMPDADPSVVRSLLSMGRTITHEDATGYSAVSNPKTYQAFSDSLVNGTLTPQDVYQARAAGQLSSKDTNYFLSGINHIQHDPEHVTALKQFNIFVKSMKPAFETANVFGTKTITPQAAQRYYEFQVEATKQFDAAYEKGNWQDVLNPKSANYLGRLGSQMLLNKKGAQAHGPVQLQGSNEQMVAAYNSLPVGALYTRPGSSKIWVKK